MPEYIALYKCVDISPRATPAPAWVSAGIPWVRRYYLEAVDLTTASKQAREYRNFFKDDLTTVTPATILESVGEYEDGKPLYKIVQYGVLEAKPDLIVWPMDMADLHIQQ